MAPKRVTHPVHDHAGDHCALPEVDEACTPCCMGFGAFKSLHARITIARIRGGVIAMPMPACHTTMALCPEEEAEKPAWLCACVVKRPGRPGWGQPKHAAPGRDTGTGTVSGKLALALRNVHARCWRRPATHAHQRAAMAPKPSQMRRAAHNAICSGALHCLLALCPGLQPQQHSEPRRRSRHQLPTGSSTNRSTNRPMLLPVGASRSPSTRSSWLWQSPDTRTSACRSGG